MSAQAQVAALLVGAAAVVTGAALLAWPAAIVAVGVLILLAVADLGRP